MSSQGRKRARDRFFWADLNKFVRAYMEDNDGRRPDRDVLQKEFSARMHEWFTQKGKLVPNLEDVLKQAKGVRLLEEQRAYMRQYREDKRNDSKDASVRKRRSLCSNSTHSQEDTFSELWGATEAEGDAARSLQVLGHTHLPLTTYGAWQPSQPSSSARSGKRPRGAGVQCLMMLVEQVRSGDACSEVRSMLAVVQQQQQQPLCQPSALAVYGLSGQPALPAPCAADLGSCCVLDLPQLQGGSCTLGLGQGQQQGVGVSQNLNLSLMQQLQQQQQQQQQQLSYLTHASQLAAPAAAASAEAAAAPAPTATTGAPCAAAEQAACCHTQRQESTASKCLEGEMAPASCSPGASNSHAPTPAADPAKGCPSGARTHTAGRKAAATGGIPLGGSTGAFPQLAALNAEPERRCSEESSTGKGDSSTCTSTQPGGLQPELGGVPESSSCAWSALQPLCHASQLKVLAASPQALQQQQQQQQDPALLSQLGSGRLARVPGLAGLGPAMHASTSNCYRAMGLPLGPSGGGFSMQLAAQMQLGEDPRLKCATPAAVAGGSVGAPLQVVQHGGMMCLVPVHLSQQLHQPRGVPLQAAGGPLPGFPPQLMATAAARAPVLTGAPLFGCSALTPAAAFTLPYHLGAGLGSCMAAMPGLLPAVAPAALQPGVPGHRRTPNPCPDLPTIQPLPA